MNGRAGATKTRGFMGMTAMKRARRAGAPHVAENAAATGIVAHAMQEGTFVTVLISGEAWPAV